MRPNVLIACPKDKEEKSYVEILNLVKKSSFDDQMSEGVQKIREKIRDDILIIPTEERMLKGSIFRKLMYLASILGTSVRGLRRFSRSEISIFSRIRNKSLKLCEKLPEVGEKYLRRLQIH